MSAPRSWASVLYDASTAHGWRARHGAASTVFTWESADRRGCWTIAVLNGRDAPRSVEVHGMAMGPTGLVRTRKRFPWSRVDAAFALPSSVAVAA